MPRRLIDLQGRPLLDIASYARPGPGRRDHLSPEEIEHISLTVHRAPEVIVKVLTRGGQDLKAVQRHLAYLNRKGELEIETDEGERIRGKGVEGDLLEDWDLDLQEHRRRAELGPRKDRAPPKLVHKILFSMPPGTEANKVLEAVKNFAREEFALKHRYAMVLHMDEPHPHVHMVVKAVSEQGVRLNIRKETLRKWRAEFARQLRARGVTANATERQIRGVSKSQKIDGIYRANLRGDSWYVRDQVEIVAAELRDRGLRVEPGKSKLVETRRQVERGWHAIGESLLYQRRGELAEQVGRFVRQMPAPQTRREALAATMLPQRHRDIVRDDRMPGR